MAPEYGATCGFFPIDNETLKYLEFSGRDQHTVEVVEKYAKSKVYGQAMKLNSQILFL